jgi:hypothetical protein
VSDASLDRIHGNRLRVLREGSNITLTPTVDDLAVVIASTGGGVPEAPIDSKYYTRKDAAWAEAPSASGASKAFAVAMAVAL